MVRHRRWSTATAFGLLVVGLVFLSGAWGASPRVRVLHPSAVAQIYGGATAVPCWDGVETTSCGPVGKACIEWTCSPVTIQGFTLQMCDAKATEEVLNVGSWYICKEAATGEDFCSDDGTVNCIKIFKCASAGKVGGCQQGNDGVWRCPDGRDNTPPTFRDPHDQSSPLGDPCPTKAP